MNTNYLFIPEQASSIAKQVDLVTLVLLLVSAAFIVAIAFFICYFSVRYRRRAENERSGTVHENWTLEIAWSVIPLFLGLGLFVVGAKVYLDTTNPPKDALEISVVAKQWMWKFQHPNGRQEINELHVPVDKPVLLRGISQDVVHSFYVPAFRVKQDIIPGRYVSTWFEAIKKGVYHLFCAEYCGTEHSKMVGRVFVMDGKEYDAWLSSAGMGGDAMFGGIAATTSGGNTKPEGERLFEYFACITCHGQGAGGRGPSLTGLFGSQVHLASGKTITADEDYLRESILNPTAKVVLGFDPVMPGYVGRISEDQVLQIVTYIKSLGAKK